MYHGQSPEHLYLFFACINKKIFLAKLPDLGSGSDKKNSELSHTNTSKSGVNISPASRPPIPRTKPTYDRSYFRNKILEL